MFLQALMESQTLEEVAVKLRLPLDEVIARAWGRPAGPPRKPRVSAPRFFEVWNRAPSAAVVALVLRRSLRQVLRWEADLRRNGFQLKRMPDGLPWFMPSDN
jgi:hypothetical protein